MNPIAIVISDLHLSLLRPACRADENWMRVQAEYLAQIEKAARGLPILCAGDIFDRWNAPPELISFALRHLPDNMLCVPGQHDLPNHRLDQVHRSGYGVLKQVGKINDIDGDSYLMDGVEVHGFGWGRMITKGRGIALIHRYCWADGKCYPGAPKATHTSAFKKELNGYNVAVFGDNHLSFDAKCGDCYILNTGGFIRRKSDEIDRDPCYGIIYDDGTVKRKRLDTSIDRFHENPKDRPEVPLDLKEFIEGLEGLGEHGLNFIEAVENHLRGEDIDPETKEIILRAIQKE